MFPKFSNNSKGQALVEFALVISLLLMIVFVIIDGGRLFQAWLTVQNAARSAARYAITGEYNRTGVFATPECPPGTPVNRWHVCSIKDEAFGAASGLNINLAAGPTQPLAFGTQVCRPDNCPPEDAGRPGEPTRVSVFYNAELVTPFLRPFAKYIRVVGRVEVVTEQFNQVSPGDITIVDIGGGGGSPPFPNLADLAVTKGPANGSGKVMQTVYYTMTVRNLGPFGTPSVQILDLLPSETVSMTGYTITDGAKVIPDATCLFNQVDQQMTCNIPYLDGDPVNPGKAEFSIGLLIAPPELEIDPNLVTVPVTNTGTVFNQIGTIDPNASNNESKVKTFISRSYDLAITKTHYPGPISQVNLGETVDFLIKVENLGPSTAAGGLVTDQLPNELRLTDILSSTGMTTCADSGSNRLECTLDVLPYGATASVRIRVKVVQANDSNVANTATVSSPLDADVSNNTSTIETYITSPALEIRKAVGPIQYYLGEPVLYADDRAVYTIQVINHGGGIASQVVLTDDMQAEPDVVSFKYNLPPSFASTPCKQASDDIVCQGFDILPGEAFSFTLQLPITPTLNGSNVRGLLSNSVKVSSNGGLERAGPLAVDTDVVRLYDLGVTKRSDLSDLPDGHVLYTVDVTNNGPTKSPPFTIADVPWIQPDGAVVTATLVSVDGLYIKSGEDCDVATNTVKCAVAPLPVGNKATFTLDVDLSGFVGTIVNSASVTDTFGIDSASTDPLVYPYELGIVKSGPAVFDPLADAGIDYTVTVTNYGPLTATFTISDVVETEPLDLIDTISIVPGGCDIGAGFSFSCVVIDLPKDESVTFATVVTPRSGGYLTNTAAILNSGSVSGAQSDFVKTTIKPLADLGVSAIVTPTTALSETFDLRFDVTNHGSAVGGATATKTRITATLQVTGTVVTATIGTYPGFSTFCTRLVRPGDTVLSLPCYIGALADQESVSVYLELVFADGSGNQFKGQVTVGSDVYDPEPTNNSKPFQGA